MPEIATIGLDIAKNVFQLHGVDRSGKIVLRKALCGAARCRGSSALCHRA